MLIGLDFDNTIVAYGALFHRVAREQGLIDDTVAVSKIAVRDALRRAGQEDAWTRLQGKVYGARMREATAYPGAVAFIRQAREQGVRICIVSHRSPQPYLGEPYDLHAAARAWLDQQGLTTGEDAVLDATNVFFETTKSAKLARIAACACDHFVDDLPEILTAAEFPSRTRAWWFAPDAPSAATGASSLSAVASWSELTATLLASDASALRRRHCLGDVLAETPITGGANNRATRLQLLDGRDIFVKHYAPIGSDGRDRFTVERAFYGYAEEVAVSHLLSPLAWDVPSRCGLFPLMEGAAPAVVTESLVDAAARFVVELQGGRDGTRAHELPAASEACFSIAAHLDTVQRRVDGLCELSGTDDVSAGVVTWVARELKPAWQRLRDQTESSFTETETQAILVPAARCISPSDFGFHNTLIDQRDVLTFLDFEYAGWDDPAKLVADFFCQPDKPVPLHTFAKFVAAVGEGVVPRVHRDDFERRCHALLPVYVLKWSCIMLNDFTPPGRVRREFSLGVKAAALRREHQFQRAQALLESRLLLAA